MITWQGTKRVLYRNGRVYAPSHPFATAVLIDGPIIAWIGDELAASAYADVADDIIDCKGRFITPGFVDAHVHATATGLALIGLDLRGTTRREEVLATLERTARESAGAPIFGHGWDETQWDDPRSLTRQEIDRATWGSVVFLSRVDVHSASISSALLTQIAGIESLAGFRDDGVLTQEAHHRAREVMLNSQSAATRLLAQRAFRQHAAEQGVVSVHEMAGPVISSFDDAHELMQLMAEEPGPLVALYWGAHESEGGIEAAQEMGAVGAGGDLFVDGSIGSHTACLHQPYADEDTTGVAYLSPDDIARHIMAATSFGLQAGFHVIGDRAMDFVTQGFQRAIEACGIAAVRERRHRLEHAEMMSDNDRSVLKDAAVTVSMQPLFDQLWGGPGGMYERRLGAARGQQLNDFAAVSREGLVLAFGSDSPVTDMNPWSAVRAAVFHQHEQSGITPRAAFHAHTRGGWRAIGQLDGGVLTPGAPAHLVIWDVDAYATAMSDERVSRWSTDPRSGLPDLPDLTVELPTCVRTVVHGTVVFDSGAW
jgi:predicted amidohydrolase YtcJ